jgi:hypothetical protein
MFNPQSSFKFPEVALTPAKKARVYGEGSNTEVASPLSVQVEELQPPTPGSSSLPSSSALSSEILEASLAPLRSRLEQSEQAYQAATLKLQEELVAMKRAQAERELMEALNSQPLVRSGVTIPEELSARAGEPITIKDLFNFGSTVQEVLGQQEGRIEAMQLRSSWGITSQEESLALQTYPEISKLPEPNKTKSIIKAVEVLRASKTSQSSPPSSTPQPVPLIAHETAAPVGGQPSDSSTAADNALLQARRHYNEAKKIQNPRKRLVEMNRWYTEILRLQGLTKNDILSKPFSSARALD